MSARHAHRGTLVAALSAVLALGGCGDSGVSDLERYVAEVKARQRSRIEPLPEFVPYETFTYQAEDLRDPFTPSVGVAAPSEESSQSGPRPDMNRPREPLEDYPLDTLRMVGTLNKDGESWGLVQAPDDTIHRVQPGNYLGQNHGRINDITEYEISITEIVPDGLGGWMERDASLALSE